MNDKNKKPKIKAPIVTLLKSDNLHLNCTQIARKAAHQESLCPLRPPWLNAFTAPAHERAPPQPAPAVRLRKSAGGMSVEGGRMEGIGEMPEEQED